jgi:hypothetical protein
MRIFTSAVSFRVKITLITESPVWRLNGFGNIGARESENVPELSIRKFLRIENRAVPAMCVFECEDSEFEHASKQSEKLKAKSDKRILFNFIIYYRLHDYQR